MWNVRSFPLPSHVQLWSRSIVSFPVGVQRSGAWPGKVAAPSESKGGERYRGLGPGRLRSKMGAYYPHKFLTLCLY